MFADAQFGEGDQAAEILVAFAVAGEERIASAVGAGDLGADVGDDAGFCAAMWKRGEP